MTVGCILFALLAQADEECPVLEEGRIDLSTSFKTVPELHDYARTCEHRTNGTFSVRVLSDPKLREEWHIDKGQPTFTWTGISGEVSGEGGSTLTVNLPGCGTSYNVMVTATWALTKEDGETATTTASEEMTFDAIDYAFQIGPPGVDGWGADHLVDSHAAELQVTARGCTHTNELSLLPEAKTMPRDGVTPQNDVGTTEMTFISRGNPLSWQIPCPYWYGGSLSNNPPACCYSNVARYEIYLNPDGCRLHRKEVSVHLPKSDLYSRMIAMPGAVKSATISIVRQEAVTNEGAIVVRTWFRLTDYEIPPAGSATEATSQYRNKIKKEENVHIQQFMRVSGYGFEDLYSLKDALLREGIRINDKYFDCESEQEAEDRFSEIKGSLQDEKKISDSYWLRNRGYIEREAKKIAGYREAYLYHCTYEKECGAGDKVLKSAVEEYYKH